MVSCKYAPRSLQHQEDNMTNLNKLGPKGIHSYCTQKIGKCFCWILDGDEEATTKTQFFPIELQGLTY